jgi:hypothetical protein
MTDNPEKRGDSDADEYSLSHDQLAQSGLFDFVDVMESRDDRWPDDRVWDLGDGVTATMKELRGDADDGDYVPARGRSRSHGAVPSERAAFAPDSERRQRPFPTGIAPP